MERLPYRQELDTRRRTMKAIVVTDQAAGTAGMKLAEQPEPPAAINPTFLPSTKIMFLINYLHDRF
jgi:hypothetical protein